MVTLVPNSLANQTQVFVLLTLSWQRPLSYRNQSIDLDWFLYDNGLRLERVKKKILIHRNSPFITKISRKFIMIRKLAHILRHNRGGGWEGDSGKCLCLTMGERVRIGGNNLFASCYRNVGRKKLFTTINLWSNQLVVTFWKKIHLQNRYLINK